MSRGSSAQTIACGSKTTRLPASWMLNVVNGVLGEGRGVDLAADRLEALAADQLRAAGEAGLGPEHVLRAARRRLRGDVLEGDEAVQEVGRAAALLDVGGDRAHLRVARGGASCAAASAPVKITSASMIITASYQSSARIRRSPWLIVCALPWPPLLAAQVEHAARVLAGLRAHDLRRLVGARVVDDVDPQPVGRVVERHQPCRSCARSPRPRSRPGSRSRRAGRRSPAAR